MRIFPLLLRAKEARELYLECKENSVTGKTIPFSAALIKDCLSEQEQIQAKIRYFILGILEPWGDWFRIVKLWKATGSLNEKHRLLKGYMKIHWCKKFREFSDLVTIGQILMKVYIYSLIQCKKSNHSIIIIPMHDPMIIPMQGLWSPFTQVS